MQSTVVMFAREPPLRPAGHRLMQRSGRHILARLRDDIAIIRAIKIDYVTISLRLEISQEEARALNSRAHTPPAMSRLTRHAIKALLNGRHAHVGGKAIQTRAKNLIKIAAAYTFEELLQEPGIGTAAAAEVQLWLEERGVSMRSPE
jgi:hypothetical protein